MSQQKYAAWPTGQQDEVLARIRAHYERGGVVQGDQKSCAISCSINKYDHEEYARVFGVAVQVAYLVDAIHEGLPPELALDWPSRVARALRPGADTTTVWPRFSVWARVQLTAVSALSFAEMADKLEAILSACPLGPVPRQGLRVSWLSGDDELYEETLTYLPEQDTWLSDGAEYSETDLRESFRRGWLVSCQPTLA